MGIVKKTLIIVATILVTVIIAFYFILRFSLLNDYLGLEKVEITNDITQALKIIKIKTADLERTASNYASWDYTYSFISEGNKDFTKTNISEEIFHNLGINIFALIDNNKQIKSVTLYDLNNNISQNVPESLKNELRSSNYLITAPNHANGLSGVSLIADNPAIIITKPVLKSSGEGPTIGTLLIAQFINEEMIKNMNSETGNTIKFYNINDQAINNDYKKIIEELLEGKSFVLRADNNNQASGYTLIKDINSTPILLLQVTSPRTIYLEGSKNINTYVLILLSIGFISCVTIILVLRKIVLFRIVYLSKKTTEIGTRRDLSKSIAFRGRDEISDLTISINRMLRELKDNEIDVKKNEKRFKDLVELLPEIVLETNKDQRITFANQAFFEITGYREEGVENGLYLSDILALEDFKRAKEIIPDLIRGGKTESSEYLAIKKDGTTFPILVSTVAINDENGDITGFRSVVLDMTNRKMEEERLREVEERWQFALEGSGDGVWDWNFETNEVFYSKRFKEILGFEESEWKNERSEAMDRIHPEDYENVLVQINNHLKGFTSNYSVEYRIKHKDGTYLWTHDRGKVIRWDGNGKPLRMIGTCSNITPRKKLEEKIKELAYRDPLTNLPNRLLFNDRLDLTIASSKRNNKKFALIILDIDRFKKINDKYGHDIGDQLILYVGKKIESLLRKSDTIARFGGDEFLLLLPEIKDGQDAEKIAEKIFNTFQEKFMLGEKKLSVTVSMGIAIYPEHGDSISTLLKNADLALYEVKDKGRNNYKLYNSQFEL
jgi:diguanylate cyclase (GGDEF)-like protein/PAS domain S-box-containing protein